MPTRATYIKRRIAVAVLLIVIIWGIGWGIRGCLHYLSLRRKFAAIEMIKGEIKPGQVLFTSLLAQNITSEAANEIVVTIGKILKLNKLKVGEQYCIYVAKDGQIVKLIYEKTPVDQYFVVRDDKGHLNAFKPAIFLEKELLIKEFTIKSSLFEAILDKDEDQSLVFDIVDVFAWDIDFYSYPRVGDKIKVYFEKNYLPADKNSKDRKFVRYGRILAAQYKGRDTFNAVYFKPKQGHAGYYNLKGDPVEKMFLKSPLKFTGRITSYFGRRIDPFTHRHGGHSGVDFASYYGAPIVATADGRVVFVGWRGAYGRLVIVQHSNGYSTRYGHCSAFLVRRGAKVAQGQVIAKVGSTGRSTGPHCHYEIRLRNRAFNPLRFNQVKKKPLKGQDLKDFKKVVPTILAKLT